MDSNVTTCRVPSPLGEILLVADAAGEALCGLYLARQKHFPTDASQWSEQRSLPLFRDVTAQLREYFAGARRSFDVPLAPAVFSVTASLKSAVVAPL